MKWRPGGTLAFRVQGYDPYVGIWKHMRTECRCIMGLHENIKNRLKNYSKIKVQPMVFMDDDGECVFYLPEMIVYNNRWEVKRKD